MTTNSKAKEMAEAIFKNTSYTLMQEKLAQFIYLSMVHEIKAEKLQAEVLKLRQTHWDMRAKAGFDNDGDPTPEAIVSDFSKLMIDDWNNVIKDQQESHDEWDNLQQENKALVKALKFMVDHAHQPNSLELRDGFAEAKQTLLQWQENRFHETSQTCTP